ncbi:MAG: glycosyltransferase family 4 protein [Candidatus Promineifilaceae bacterium]
MSLKIGLVTGEYPPMEGGVGAFTRELAQAMAAQDHEIHVITNRKARPSSDDRRWWLLNDPIEVEYGYLHPRMRRWWWPDMSTIADLVVRHDLDVINVQYQAAAFDMHIPAINFLPWRLREVCKTAVTFHDLRVPYLFPKAGRLRQWVVRQMARLAEGVIVTNRADQEALVAAGLSPQEICRIPIGSNITTRIPEAAEIAAVRQSLTLEPDDLLLGYFGFLNESKGADTLINAVAKLDDHIRDQRIHLIFTGGQTGSSDPDNNAAFLARLERLVAGLGLAERVHWSGFLPDKEVSTYLHAADLIVMPYKDGVSLRRGTLMAALAHGRPIITTEPAVPIPELCHGENIWYVPVEDASSLAAAIAHLAQNRSLAAQLGSGAAAAADLFTWDKIAKQTADYLASLKEG